MNVQLVILNVSLIFLAKINVWSKLHRKNFSLIHTQACDGMRGHSLSKHWKGEEGEGV